MQRIAYTNVVDKSNWPPGPWKDEPDKVQWRDEATGLPCLIVRGPVGSWCGYVGVGRSHPYHGLGYNDLYEKDMDVSVHGGLTFANGCSHGDNPGQSICHIVEPGEDDNIHWFGFDCAHGGDLSPSPTMYSYTTRAVYRDMAYVEAEVARLAKQLADRGKAA